MANAICFTVCILERHFKKDLKMENAETQISRFFDYTEITEIRAPKAQSAICEINDPPEKLEKVYIEGPWPKEKGEYPYLKYDERSGQEPVEILGDWGAKKFAQRLELLEEQPRLYDSERRLNVRREERGQAQFCRLHCSEFVGGKEFRYRFRNVTYVWPEGLMHYIEEHNVRPSEKFENMVCAATRNLTLTLPQRLRKKLFGKVKSAVILSLR